MDTCHTSSDSSKWTALLKSNQSISNKKVNSIILLKTLKSSIILLLLLYKTLQLLKAVHVAHPFMRNHGELDHLNYLVFMEIWVQKI